MNPRRSASILKRYSERYREHGFSPKTLGWQNGRQGIRFEILSGHWNWNGASVLDVGCGFGDLYRYLKEKGIAASYRGVDINPDLIAEGRRQYPKADLRVGDPFVDGIRGKFDYIVCSGLFNTRQKGAWKMVENAFDLFNRRALKGFAANFLSTKVDYRLRHAHHSDPAKVLTLAYRFSNRIVLRNDYMPFEFSVFVDKRTAFNAKKAVYPEYEELADWPG